MYLHGSFFVFLCCWILIKYFVFLFVCMFVHVLNLLVSFSRNFFLFQVPCRPVIKFPCALWKAETTVFQSSYLGGNIWEFLTSGIQCWWNLPFHVQIGAEIGPEGIEQVIDTWTDKNRKPQLHRVGMPRKRLKPEFSRGFHFVIH